MVLKDALYVATAPTVYGIETLLTPINQQQALQLQQHLPFTVLKPVMVY